MLEIFRSSILLFGLSYTAWTDWKERRIPNRLLICMLVPAGMSLLMEGTDVFLRAVSGLMIVGMVFYVFYASFQGSMGAGDVKLAAVVGFYLGIGKAACMFALAFCLAAAVCAILLFLRRMDIRQRIPFAPFLLVSAVILMSMGV